MRYTRVTECRGSICGKIWVCEESKEKDVKPSSDVFFVFKLKKKAHDMVEGLPTRR